MSAFGVSEKKEAALKARMEALGIRETDLKEQFVRPSGKGGQKLQKTSSCVILHHGPSDISVRASRERSQAINRYLARRLLCERLENELLGSASAQAQAAEKIRRQKKRRKRRQRVAEVRPNEAD